MKKTRKTLYSVDWNNGQRIETKWFESKDDAKKFAENDYTDNPVAHNFGIERAKEIMRTQKEEDSLKEQMLMDLFPDK